MIRVIKWIASVFLLILLVLLAMIFIPRSYNVSEFVERPGTLYWNLDSTSQIGYTYIQSTEERSKSPIIYLHGGPGGAVGDRVIESYRSLSTMGHDLYFYDQIGSGHSTRLEDISGYTIARHVEDLIQIVNRIASDRVILIGQSWGAMLAVEFLYNHEEKVEQVILTNPGPILPFERNIIASKAPDSLGMRKPLFSNREGNKKANNIRSRLVHKYALASGKKLGSDEEMDDFFTHLNTELRRSTVCDGSVTEPSSGGGGFYCHAMTVQDFSRQVNRKDRLKASKINVTIIKGQCDSKPWSYTQEYLDLFQNSDVHVIENSGHDLHSGNNQELLDIISPIL